MKNLALFGRVWTVLAAFYLAHAGIAAASTPATSSTYALTKGSYPVTANLAACAQAEYGVGTAVADWKNIKARYGGADAAAKAFCNEAGFSAVGSSAWVLFNGRGVNGGVHRYCVERHDGQVPSGFVLNGVMGTHVLDLGTAFKGKKRILVALAPGTPVIKTSASPASRGTTSGSGPCMAGKFVTVVAAAATGCQFVGWTEGGTVVSPALRYTFTAVANRTLVANFVKLLTGFAPIPAGKFQMGDALREGAPNELPVHTVYVSAFSMERTLVTKSQWDTVYGWAVGNGYSFDRAAAGKALNHPVQNVDWYDAVKWCNARSEKDGLTPCYTVGGSVFRRGDSNSVVCNLNASGYRLPTEAEWEKAARGRLVRKRFPWLAGTIGEAQANYFGDPTNYYFHRDWGHIADYTYDHGPVGYNRAYQQGGEPYTNPVGAFAANGYGLYDMAGNVWEWCWDWNSSTYYATSPRNDPAGPASGSYRATRGGSWDSYAIFLRAAFRYYRHPTDAFNYGGFRCVLRGNPVDTISPSLNITSPADGATVSGASVTVTGQASDSGLGNRGIASVTVNGVEAGGDKASGSDTANWSANVPLVLGANSVTVIATDGAGNTTQQSISVNYSATPPVMTGNFVPIASGTFSMGDAIGDGNPDELPVHTVTVSAFYMETTLVTESQWSGVQAWGAAHGYSDLALGSGADGQGHSKAAAYPVVDVDWYDVVKWCNARSEQDGLTPCYTLSGTVYRTGTSDSVACDWSANGYRLPTEAEWEKAGRGGLVGQRFPWGNTIDRSWANYIVASSDGTTNLYPYDWGTPIGFDPTWEVGNWPYPSPVGSYPANGYGLYDMAGNVFEWCWDWYGSYGSGALSDPTGLASGSDRVLRGGSWYDSAFDCRVSSRYISYPANRFINNGFRCVRR